MSTLPYVTAPGNIEKALVQIKSAATPETVSQDFVKTILGIRGGSGNQVTSYLRKIGFVGSDGKPSELYKKFRNSSTEGWAAAKALKIGYAALYARNEYMHSLDDSKLKGLIVEETGAEASSPVVACVFSCIKGLKRFASWNNDAAGEKEEAVISVAAPPIVSNEFERQAPAGAVGLNLGYTINLNLPATSDPAVFNAIFRALKEHLLSVP
ncbi:DUF5343 domain-containing protein [Pinirhizobacter soli]|uniref:DUF5343 domain-containing protein n=1 Tax=Pinirhizobacter soli TaxID=2786953 RepID=UPI00202A36FD|nr:DUF5343 domain-containing protein [Pinirhizobacter soli]